MLFCILISTTDGKIYKTELKDLVLADVSMLKEENRVQGASGLACHAVRDSDTKASCMHDNLCYSLDISTIAVSSKPSNPVNCYVKKQDILPTKGN